MKNLIFAFIFLLLVACLPQQDTVLDPVVPEPEFVYVIDAADITISVGSTYEVSWRAEGGTKI